MAAINNTDSIPDLEDEASDLFVERLHGEWSEQKQLALETRLMSEPAFADAFRRVEESWAAIGKHAEIPELVVYREGALSTIRRSNVRRWQLREGFPPWRLAAGLAAVSVALGVAWQLSPWGYKPGQYRTGIGEQRILELDDHSRITLDAATRLNVRYSKDARIVELVGGQAQFSVAKDSLRPFKVLAGDRTIVALGTIFNVEYTASEVNVSMLEGKVAVVSSNASNSSPPSPLHPIERGASKMMDKDANPFPHKGEVFLTAGEALKVDRNGQTTFTPKADLEVASAWREGKVISRTEPLREAVRRMNRYSRVQIEIADEALAARHISGVFEAGDTQGFVSVLQRYLPLTAIHTDSDTIRLDAR